jgi:hypothetical protein
MPLADDTKRSLRLAMGNSYLADVLAAKIDGNGSFVTETEQKATRSLSLALGSSRIAGDLLGKIPAPAGLQAETKRQARRVLGSTRLGDDLVAGVEA